MAEDDGLYGKTLNVITVIEQPYVNRLEVTFTKDLSKLRTSPGLVMHMLDQIGQEFNFTYNVVKQSDGKWGDKVNGSWNGMVGSLTRKESDILAGAAIVRLDRAEVIDYSVPFLYTESGMLMRSPDTVEDTRFVIITAPLQWHVWMTCVAAVILSAFLLKILEKPLVKVNAETNLTWVESFWLFYSIFIQQEVKKLPISFATRTFLSFWYIAALTITAIFTSNMVAAFSVKKQVPPFNDVQGFVEKMASENYKIILQNTTLSRIQFIQNSDSAHFKQMWKEMTVNKKWINVTSLEDGIAIVLRDRKAVFVGAKETLQVEASANCNMTLLDSGLIPVWFSMGFQKKSNLTQIFSQRMDMLQERGFITKWLTDDLLQLASDRGDLCQFKGSVETSGKAIDLLRAQGAFWILLMGGFAGSVIFILEIIYPLICNAFGSKTISKVRMIVVKPSIAVGTDDISELNYQIYGKRRQSKIPVRISHDIKDETTEAHRRRT